MRYFIILLVLLFGGEYGSTDVTDYVSYPKERERWRKFYKKHFKLDKNFGFLKIPVPRPGFDYLMIVAKEMKVPLLVKKIRGTSDSFLELTGYFEEDLYSLSSKYGLNKDYAVWIRGNQENDLEIPFGDCKNYSLITAEEHLLLEFRYFMETKRHL